MLNSSVLHIFSVEVDWKVNKKHMFAVAVLASMAYGMVPSYASTTGTISPPTSTFQYQIQSGDTLFKITQTYQTSLSIVEELNPQITNFNNLSIGQMVTVPIPVSPYVIQQGDTMFTIAQAHGVSLTELEQANQQIGNYSNVLVGETIQVPDLAVTGNTPISTNLASQAATVQNIISLAKSLLGVHYQWGGDTPQTGFDCSGFVYYIFGQNGIQLPRTAHQQATVGTSVAKSLVQPGDLLFFTDTDQYAGNYVNQVTHVGIYIGNGEMIESSSASNDEGVVVVQNVFQNPYYSAHFYGIQNVIE